MFLALGAACDAAPMPVSYFFVNRSDYVANVAPPASPPWSATRTPRARARVDVDITVYGYASARALVASVDAPLLFFWDRWQFDDADSAGARGAYVGACEAT
ncbi:hypothetical protein SO694_00015334 [Aureococcus anophagefferens]|uniref:Uncharacterized protein n=1 Tax=Aureococcus anophagefferens TaxID=44056 RepID=A0ABR1G345_AURAN